MFPTAPASNGDSSLRVKLDRPIDRDGRVAETSASIAPQRASRWRTDAPTAANTAVVSRTAQWIEHVATRFGAPPTVVCAKPTHSKRSAWHINNNIMNINTIPTSS